MALKACLLGAIAGLVILTGGCASRSNLAVQPTERPAEVPVAQPVRGLPAVNDLPRSTAHVSKIDGHLFTFAAHYEVDEINITGAPLLVLDPAIEPIKPEPGITDTDFAWAIYIFSGIEEPVATAKVSTFGNYYDQLWVGLADWDMGCWVYGEKPHVDNPVIDLDDNSAGGSPYLSDDGRIALVVIVEEGAAPINIKEAQVTTLDDLTGLEATTDRWDGVLLTWDYVAGTADGFKVSRRLPGQPDDAWELLTAQHLPKSIVSFFDEDVPQCVSYEYLVQLGIWEVPGSQLKWYWSEGRTAVGELVVQTVEDDAADAAIFWPANLYNQLSFFFSSPDAPGSLSVAQGDGFPVAGVWDFHIGGQEGFADIALASVTGFGPPVSLYQATQQNNQAITVGYSTAEGTFSLVGTIDTEGMVDWLEPVLVHGPETFLLNLCTLPRRIGGVCWNTSTDRIEMVHSIDMYGTGWYDFDPEHYPWMIVSKRKPRGQVSSTEANGTTYLVYQEDSTDQAVVLKIGAIWYDVSPGLTVGPNPKLREYVVLPYPARFALFHISDDLRRVKMVPHDIGQGWLTGSSVTTVLAPEGAEITDFDVFLFTPSAHRTYLAYIQDDDLYLAYSAEPDLTTWYDPVLIDDSGDCRNIKIWRVGSDDEYNYRIYMTYLSDDDSGQTRIHFRDVESVQFAL